MAMNTQTLSRVGWLPTSTERRVGRHKLQRTPDTRRVELRLLCGMAKGLTLRINHISLLPPWGQGDLDLPTAWVSRAAATDAIDKLLL